MNYHSVKELSSELEDAITNFQDYHAEMNTMRRYYKHSAFFKPKSGDSPIKKDRYTNMLKVFADKNIHYTSPFPVIKVPTTGASQEQRQAASIREKILYATHRKNGTPQLRKKWAFDGTIFSAAVAETGFDLKKRRAYVKRYDPRHCFWQLSNDNDGRIIAFWAVYPITKEECKRRYGKEPTKDFLNLATVQNEYMKKIDGQDWFTMAVRLDDKVKVAWVGDIIVEEPHNHLQTEVPIDICFPFEDGDSQQRGGFYLEPLISNQAELNDTIYQRAMIVRRMGNPTVWARGAVSRQNDDIKARMAQAGGGFVGLKRDGELGLLQVNDTRMLDEQEKSILGNMMRLSGFSSATFGESVGANTSGDALGMYFTPTVRMIENQNISWTAFDESINAKILRCYDLFLKTGEKVNLSGFAPRGTLQGIGDANSQVTYKSGGFDVEFDKSVIAGNYTSICEQPAVTPKNENEEKTFWRDSAQQGVISKTTAYEKIGLESPEDEIELLKLENSEPVLNPDGTSTILNTQLAMQQGQNPQLPTATHNSPQLPSPQPVPIAGSV